ncbi:MULTISPECIES: hypothetical protein [unclassified Streptomyces]
MGVSRATLYRALADTE